MKIRIFVNNLFGLLFFLSLLSGPPAFAQKTALSVAIAHWPPWKITDQDKFGGIDVEILKALEKQLDIRFTFVECPWRRCLDMVKNGDVDMITSFGRTPEREEYVYYLGPPYVVEELVFYVRKGKGPRIEKYEDLYSAAIGLIKGSVYFFPFDKDPKINKTEVTWERQLFEMLSSGRITVIIGYETTIDYMAIIEGFQGRFEKMPFRVSGSGSHLAMSKRSDHAELIPGLTAAIRKMVRENQMESIITTYLKTLEQQSQ